MRRLLAGIVGGTRARGALAGADAEAGATPLPPPPDPADELRRKLAEARETEDDRDEFDAAEGTPVDQVEEPRSLEERRRAVHEQAQEALGRMQQATPKTKADD